MNRNLLIFALILLILVVVAFYFLGGNLRSQFSQSNSSTTINGQTISLEIADTPEERAQGLSGRESLADDKGLLFTFEKADTHQFWMKDMKFPIDMIFLMDDTIVTIHKNVQPEIGEEGVQNLTLYGPVEPVNRVLELNAGRADELQLKEGDKLQLNLQ